MKTLTFYGIQRKSTGILVHVWSGHYHGEDGHKLTEYTDHPIWMVPQKQDALDVLNHVEKPWSGRSYFNPEYEFDLKTEDFEVVEIKVNW